MQEDYYRKYKVDVVHNEADFEANLKSSSTVRKKSSTTPVEDFELTPKFPVINQGTLGSCVGCSGALVMAEGKPLSALWLYIQAKLHDEFKGEAYSGTSLTGACYALSKVGICTEALLPYGPNENVEITLGQYQDAAPRKISGYYTMAYSLQDDLMNVLKSGKVLWLSFGVRDGFYSCYNDGYLSDEEAYFNTPKTGSHAVGIIGWKTVNSKLYWKLQNSWGRDFGDRGCFYISADLLPKISRGVYVVNKAGEPSNARFKLTLWVTQFVLKLLAKLGLVRP